MTAAAEAWPPWDAVDPDHVSRATDLNQQLMLLSRSLHVLKSSVAQTSSDGVPWSTYLLLFHLIAQGPMRAGALAEVASIDPSTASRQVDVLVRLGLVTRQADPEDGRATLLVATDDGVATQQRMRAGRDRMMAGLLLEWPDADVWNLTTLLERLNGELSRQLPRIVAAMPARPDHEESR